MNKQFIYGNWKMAQSLEGLKSFFEASKRFAWSRSSLELAVFPSFVHLESALHQSKLCLRGDLPIGGQDCSTEKEGPYTGEVSAQSLYEMGCRHVLIGHSERRRRLPESAESLTAKVTRALAAHLNIVFCVGESERERSEGRTLAVLKEQFAVLQPFLSPTQSSLWVAYEPVWAIGTGKVAALSDIAEAHSFLRELVGENRPLLYGGSVNAKNAGEILRVAHVNGVLVGGASLKADDFWAIAQSSPFFAL